MSKPNDGGPVFPCVVKPWEEEEEEMFAPGDSYSSSGMSLRDYFAAHCDVGAYEPIATFQQKHQRRPTVAELAEYIASIRFIEADAMIAARGKVVE